MAKRISVINFKGGVGKTTLAFHLATGLAWMHGAKVLLVDVDHQSSLSDVCMGVERWKRVAESGDTVSKIFLSFVSETHEMPGKEIIVENPIYDLLGGESQENALYYYVDVAPASLELDTIEIELTSEHQGSAIRSEWNKRTLICKWLEGGRWNHNLNDDRSIDDWFDYIIFDCPPATKIVSQNAIAASHGYIIPVIPEAAMQRGLPHFLETIKFIDRMLAAYRELSPREQRRFYVPETKLAGIAVLWVRGNVGRRGTTIDHGRHLTELEEYVESEIGLDYLFEPYIPHTTLVSRAMGDNKPVYDMDESELEDNLLKVRETDDDWQRIDDFYKELVNAIKPRIDSL